MKERLTNTQYLCSVAAENRCSTCKHLKSLQLGGRPKRKAGPGRPSMKDVHAVISHLKCIAPYSLVPYTSIMPTISDKQLSVSVAYA